MTQIKGTVIGDERILAALENLRRALGGRIGTEWGTNVIYARTHQDGRRFRRGESRVTIESRAFLGVNARDRLALLRLVEDSASRSWGGEIVKGIDVSRAIGRYLKTSTQLRFRTQIAPDGKRWRPSKRVLAHGGQTLRLSSRMRNSITYNTL